jgi:hypothetical protein
MPLTIKDVGVDEEKLREILRDFYKHITGIDDFGCKHCFEALSRILDLPCKIELDEDMLMLTLSEKIPECEDTFGDNLQQLDLRKLVQALKSKQEEIVKGVTNERNQI